ncbi:hypothetical protein NC653_029520 [Populus alba x Populus x berolinensis]|uniref:Uncharacterized protein n=1 Tax=Populus alba x Populus x berolinensis TaxID=444605 RepID=A0AAD6M299_9ROSI|nr:hypothetical protein NC653_029520 [Populus alba x Populus x berolinensis]
MTVNKVKAFSFLIIRRSSRFPGGFQITWRTRHATTRSFGVSLRREGFSAFFILGRCMDTNGCQQSDLVLLFETLKPSQAKPEKSCSTVTDRDPMEETLMAVRGTDVKT